jgi:fatty acid desaturase
MNVIHLADLKRELATAGVFEHRAGSSWASFAAMLGAFLALAAAMIALPWWGAALVAPLAAVPLTTACMIGHGAGHRSMARSARHNEIAYHLLFPLFCGLGALHWKNKHNVLHHGHPNVHGVDEDIDLWPLACSLRDHERSGRFRRWFQLHLQGYAFWPLTLLLQVMMRTASVRHLVTHIRTRGLDRAAATDIACLTGHYALWLALPAAMFGFVPALGFYLAVWSCVGVLLAIVFAPAHIGLPIVDAQERGWLHQLQTTRNLRLPRWLSWFFVGLDFQVEHHLFPGIPHQNMRAASVIVRRWCARVGAPWQEIGYGAAIADVTRFLVDGWRRPPSPLAPLAVPAAADPPPAQ